MPEPYESFESWYRATHRGMVSSLTLVAGDVEMATEATDEAFVRALERWAQVDMMVSPTGWVYQVALNYLRRRARRSIRERVLLAGVGETAPPPDWSIELWDAVRLLPTRERTAIVLRYVADLSTDEIAHAMEIRPGTVGSTLSSARAKLARSLGEQSAAATGDLAGVGDSTENDDG